MKSASRVIRTTDGIMFSNDFFGQINVSTNRLFTLGWHDSHQKFTVNGKIRNMPGRYILLEGENLILTGEMQRPNDGHVSNMGTFAFCDWTFTNELKGTFRVIDKSGKQLISHVFKANLYNCGISDDGLFAVCQTCSSPHNDGDKLGFFDIKSGKLLWMLAPPTGAAEKYKFDVEKKILHLFFQEKGEFSYSFSGEFKDPKHF
jgi:hypothetical protein